MIFVHCFHAEAPIKNMSYDLCTPQAFLGFKTFSVCVPGCQSDSFAYQQEIQMNLVGDSLCLGLEALGGFEISISVLKGKAKHRVIRPVEGALSQCSDSRLESLLNPSLNCTLNIDMVVSIVGLVQLVRHPAAMTAAMQ